MGCCAGQREKGLIVSEDQKWDYINLSDFKSTSCLAPFSYVWLWILVVVSCAVYVADAFTAINLIAFDKWSSQVQPKVPFMIAKWIFAITIILSYVFLIYRWIRATRVMRSGSVTECYLEPLAAILQSMRMGKRGQGWRRFLVFAELTKSKKGANYVALFVYFQFKSALLIIVAQGPRIAINGMTLYAVMQAQLLPVGDHVGKDRSNFEQFFVNIKVMVEQGNRQETIIYFTMLFSLVIWVIAALGLLIAALLYLLFLWHWIPRSDGSLTNYCRRKVESRLERIVGKTVKKALEKAEQKRREEERKAIKKGKMDANLQTKPTLPKIGAEDDASTVYSLQRSDSIGTTTTTATFANGLTRTNTMTTNQTGEPTLPTLDERPYMPTRSNTQYTTASTTSYRSNVPLLGDAGAMGAAPPSEPMVPFDRNAEYFNNGPPPRQFGGPGPRPFTPTSQGRASPLPGRGPLPPVDTSYSSHRYAPDPQVISPLPNDLRGPPPASSTRPYPEFSPFNSRGPHAGQSYELSPVDNTPSAYTPQHDYAQSIISEYQPPQLPSALRAGSPAMSMTSNRLPSAPRAGSVPPVRAGTAPPRPGVPASLQSAIQRREASQPFPNRGMTSSVPQQRSATAPIQPSYSGIIQGPVDRSYTPSNQSQRGYEQGYDQSYRY